MPVEVCKGIYQIHWCIHKSVMALPLSLTDRASPEISSDMVETLLQEKLTLSWEV